MKHLRLLAFREDREELLGRLQRLGCVEVSEPEPVEDDPDRIGLTRPESGALEAARDRRDLAGEALQILAHYAPEKKKLLAPRPEVREQELFDDDAYDMAAEAARTICDIQQKVGSLKSEAGKLQTQRAALAPWLELDVPLDAPSTREVTVLLGTFPAAADLIELKGTLGELCVLTEASTDANFHYVFLMYHNGDREKVQAALLEAGFSRTTFRDLTGTAAENDRRLEHELAENQKETQRHEELVVGYSGQRSAIQLCSDRAEQELHREEAKGRLLDTGTTFLLEGWLPADDEEKLKQLLGGYDCAWETADPTEEQIPEVPVQLKNNPVTAPLNVVTSMYSLPAYDGLDPNPLMAPFFIGFFGMMMADMAYGLIMIIASLVVLKKTRPREGTRNFMGLVLLCGIATFIVGAMTGGFFGDFIPQILKIIDPSSTFVMPALFTPLDDTVSILLGSLVLGAIQVFTGMLISVIKKIRDGDFIDALFDEITWWIILGGGALAIFGIGNVAGVPVVLVIGALMLIFGGTRKARGFGKLASLVGLVYNGVTGFFSDILSYMRLMALMLAGSVIAQVFNTLGSVFGNVVVFIIISLIGNMLNLALNLLGCYVHDLRLQCLEFFGRFYKEGGKPFKPLNLETKYVDIMKEEL